MKAALRHGAAEALVSSTPTVLETHEGLLSGHSGARVALHSNGLDSFVRKTAATPTVSARLMAQADKQHSLWMLGLPFPKVRALSTDGAGISSFDMNYIPGRTIADAVMNGAFFDPAAVVKAVERLMGLFVMGAGDYLPASLFENKIRSVSCAAIANSPDLIRAIENCAELLLIQDWRGIPESPCHGDLTLENILLTSGKSIAFVDCDAPFASSYWLDFGKLFQDLDGYWCIRALLGTDNDVRLLNATQKLGMLGTRFRHLAADLDIRLADRLPQLASLGLFRAVPYARSDHVRLFLCHRIAHLLRQYT